MSAVLLGAGAAIFLLLGLAHAVFTLQSTPTGGPMMPTDTALVAAMQVPGGIGLDPGIETTLYRGWIGFNYSHSLGVVVVAGVLLYHAIADIGAATASLGFVLFAAIGPALYLALAMRYWFEKPRNAIAVATMLIWAGLVLEVL